MEFTDEGLWLHHVSDAAGSSIKQAVFTFRSEHNLSDGSWDIHVYGISGGSLDAWIEAPPTYREPYSLLDDADAGRKLLEILEHKFATCMRRSPNKNQTLQRLRCRIRNPFPSGSCGLVARCPR